MTTMQRAIIFLMFLWMLLASYKIGVHNDEITQTQSDIAQMKQQIAQQKADDSLQHQTLYERIDYLTHPKVANERAVEWIMGRGEFAK